MMYNRVYHVYMKRITVLGGGTGSYVILSGLKQTGHDLAVIVTMMDSGGSTGKLRDQLGVLPPGDLRQCLVALSDAPLLWRRLFLYRFESGDLLGHNFGNLFISALEKVCSNYEEVVDTASFVLKTKGSVIPVTIRKAHLCVQYKNGKMVKGEGIIDSNIKEKRRIERAFLEPKAVALPRALERIQQSHSIIIGPGDLYTSIIPILLTGGMKEAMRLYKGKIIYIMNLMTKRGQTTGYTAWDHLNDLHTYLGRNVDVVVINNGKIPKKILEWYTENGEQPVINNISSAFQGVVREADLIDRKEYTKMKTDILVNPSSRSILRHDGAKTIKAILDLL